MNALNLRRVLIGSALAGASLGIVLQLIAGGLLRSDSGARLLAAAALDGAIGGVLLLPLAIWALLGPVPPGRALLCTGAATTLGAALAFGFFGMSPALATVGGTAGFALAAAWLRWSGRATHLA